MVEIQTTDSNGNTRSVQGTVEYVAYENNQAFVSVDGALYSVDDVKAVIDGTYQTALDLAVAFTAALNKLPSLENITLADKDAIETLQKGFNSMTSYQQSFIANSNIEKLQKYVELLAQLIEAAEKDEENGGSEGTEGDKTEGTETTEGTEGVGNEGSE